MPAAPRPAARHSFGSCVVLPEPVSPAIDDDLVRADQVDDPFGLRRDRQDRHPLRPRGSNAVRAPRAWRSRPAAPARMPPAPVASPARALQRDHRPCSRPTIARQRTIDRAPGRASSAVFAVASIDFIDRFGSDNPFHSGPAGRLLWPQPPSGARPWHTTSDTTTAGPRRRRAGHRYRDRCEDDRKQIADGLSRFLADAYTLYLKTHNFHWNVTGPMFNSLHVMFETQYTEQWTALDEIAERIRALGFNAPRLVRRIHPAVVDRRRAGARPHRRTGRTWCSQLTLGNEARMPHRAQGAEGRRRCRRRPDRGPADPAPAGPREIRVDAPFAAAIDSMQSYR